MDKIIAHPKLSMHLCPAMENAAIDSTDSLNDPKAILLMTYLDNYLASPNDESDMRSDIYRTITLGLFTKRAHKMMIWNPQKVRAVLHRLRMTNYAYRKPTIHELVEALGTVVKDVAEDASADTNKKKEGGILEPYFNICFDASIDGYPW
jgi:hypothetical protein